MKKIIIIGAGPAGLAAADKLCEHKLNPIVLEKDSCVAGISRTVKYKGYYFDIGGHRFLAKINQSLTGGMIYWEKILLGRAADIK
jgi:protoporphyrinogen oxidase